MANPLYMAPGPARGLVQPGNIDLQQLPVVYNPDGSYSTVNSTSFTDERKGSPTYGKEVLVRGILNNKRVDPSNPQVMDQIRQEYYRTGKHLGIFNDGDAADEYGIRLHNDWAGGKIPGVQMPAKEFINPSLPPPPGLQMQPVQHPILSVLQQILGR